MYNRPVHNEPIDYGQRISVVGTTGCGKTTVARELSRFLNLPHIELDALYWDENWTGVSDSVFEERVRAAVEGERWVIDGNYSRIRHLVWGRAQTVVFLDYTFGIVFWQLLKRTFRRSFSGEVLWSGNRESFSKSILSRDSILLWMLQTYRRRRRNYAKYFQWAKYAHLQVVHLRNPQMTEAWLKSLK